jgi:hypothetical protein
LVDSLSRVHVILNLRKLAHRELDHLHNRKNIREHETSDTRVHREAARDDEDTRSENEQDADDVEAHAEPALVGERQVVRRVHVVNGLADAARELVLQSVCADSGGAHDGLAEAGEDCAAENSFVALDFAGGGAVEGSGKEEDDEQGSERDGVVIVVRDDEDEDTLMC